MNPILVLRGNREFDLENETEVMRLGLHVLALEDKLTVALEQTEKLQAMLGQMIARQDVEPTTPIDNVTPVVVELRQILSELESGNRRIVAAQMADRVLVRDKFGEQTRSRVDLEGE